MQSMTGFGRADGSDGTQHWGFEIRSVNARGIDVRFRLPAGYDDLEPAIRAAVAGVIGRGSLNIALTAERATAAQVIRINEAALGQVLAAVQRVREVIQGPPPTPEGLLALHGVLEVVETVESEPDRAARRAGMVATLVTALDALVADRMREGARLHAVISNQLEEIERLVAAIAHAPARAPDVIRQRLAAQISRLMGEAGGLTSDRLHQEALVILTRADVEEELQRLTSHLVAARELLAEVAPVGRKFDFLTQEFNREANTLCAKANDPDMSRAGLAIKVIVDQMREQVANIQ